MRSIWQIILERIARAREDISRLLSPRDPTDTVGFSIAFIALAAKLAKADGQVTPDEVQMFRRIFLIPPEEEANAARVYNLCRQETTGYEAYARNMKKLLGEGDRAEEVRYDVLDGLFHIAMADGEFHPEEEKFLEVVHGIFDLPHTAYDGLMARHIPDAWNPWRVLDVPPEADNDRIRDAWRRLIKQNHPDALIARGLPPDMVALANTRVADINRAYEAIMSRRTVSAAGC